MRAWLMLPLALTACGPREAELPADPVDRAATCGVVAAAQARKASNNVEAKLTLEQQGRILHYALLAGAEGGSFDKTRAAGVVNAMPGLGDKVTQGKWDRLIPQCEAAYPATKAGDVTLPSDRLEAEAGCQDLAEFFTTAMRQSEADYIDRIRLYDQMRRDLDPKLGATIRARGMSQKQGEIARDKALAKVVQLGSPVAVLDACAKRFGAEPGG
ncbi:hypothetical protein [Sphingomonas sp.]|uniref:hypothetical protein n=1 Tax=Sphingomonas sp. TaxID=28214 RepID=UPI002DEE4C07|nr:hypothetical protein [Sphingomonas sp.]